jgi:hypothetical protein
MHQPFSTGFSSTVTPRSSHRFHIYAPSSTVPLLEINKRHRLGSHIEGRSRTGELVINRPQHRDIRVTTVECPFNYIQFETKYVTVFTVSYY